MNPIETRRLLFRPWSVDDAEELFALAQDPDVGPRAGWPPHQSVEESREVIRTVFASDHVWALVEKSTGHIVGCMGYYTHEESNIGIAVRPWQPICRSSISVKGTKVKRATSFVTSMEVKKGSKTSAIPSARPF